VESDGGSLPLSAWHAFCWVIKPVCSPDTWDTGVQYLKRRYLESLNFSASYVWGFTLSPGIPLGVKVEEGGSLEGLFCLVWMRATSIQGFLIPADTTVEFLTGGSFFPTC